MAIIVAFLADVLVAPALMVLVDRWRAKQVTVHSATAGPSVAATTCTTLAP